MDIQACAKVLGTYNFFAFYKKLNIGGKISKRFLTILKHKNRALNLRLNLLSIRYFVPNLHKIEK